MTSKGAKTTVVRGGTVYAYSNGGHRPTAEGDLAFRGGRIVHAGSRYEGHVDAVIDATGQAVFPGLVSTHAHVGLHAGDRLLLDHGRRDFPRTGFLNSVPTLGAPDASPMPIEDALAVARFGLACLLAGGVTTAVDFSGAGPELRLAAEAAAEAGLRLYHAPLIRGGSYGYDLAGHLHRHMDESAARRQLAVQCDYIATHLDSEDPSAILMLDEFFNSTPAVLKELGAEADRLRVPVTMHFSEQVYEFHDCVLRTGQTPVQQLADCGLLRPGVILAHCLYVTGHSVADRPGNGDLHLLAQGGATVSHSPVAVARRGSALESFGRYRDAGVRLAMGTDSYPLDMLAEMRWAAQLARIVERDASSVCAQDVFEAATVGGADALGREDLGRLCHGGRADFFLLDLEDERFGSVDDPVEALVFHATPAQISAVYTDGTEIARRGEILAWRDRDLVSPARHLARALWQSFEAGHWSGQRLDRLFPAAYPPWNPG